MDEDGRVYLTLHEARLIMGSIEVVMDILGDTLADAETRNAETTGLRMALAQLAQVAVRGAALYGATERRDA